MPFYNISTQHVCLERSCDYGLHLKTTMSGHVTLLFHSVMNVKATTCTLDCFGVAGLC